MTQMQYPSAEELMEQLENSRDKNARLLETRKSVRSILSQLFLFFVAAAVILALNIFFPGGNVIGFLTDELHISMRWLSLIPVVLFLEAVRQYHDDLYVFTATNLTHFDGRLSLNYSVPNIRYVDIRAVVVYQDVIGRMLDYGDIEVDTAAQEKTEMYIQGVRAPRELAELIEGLRHYSKKSALKSNPELDVAEISED